MDAAPRWERRTGGRRVARATRVDIARASAMRAGAACARRERPTGRAARQVPARWCRGRRPGRRG
jgi:hypothetical protein